MENPSRSQLAINGERQPPELLREVRILDLADEKASFCSKLLAEMGAQVIKIEKPSGDPSRKRGPFLKRANENPLSLSFLYNNINKRGITLDLECAEGIAIFQRLIKRCDVVVETFSPGHLDRLGIGFQCMRQINEGLILTSVTGFGQSGPKKSHKSCDLVAAASGGQMYVTGLADREPLKNFGDQSYLAASLFGAISIILALRKRREKRRGEHIDISLQEAVTATLEHVLVRFFTEKAVSRRQGSLHWNHLFHILPCKDGFLQLTLFDNWETLVEWMDAEGMAADLKQEKYRDEAYRLAHFEHFIVLLEKWTRTHTCKELFQLGQLMRFPWAPVYSPREVIESDQLASRDFFYTMDHTESGYQITCPAFPARISGVSGIRHASAPRIGEHNIHIYHNELGMSLEEIEKLSSLGVI